MLFLDHLTVQFGERVLFRDLSLLIRPRDRIGLVGSNGSGKTTLLRVIAGLQPTDSGTLQKASYVTIGYLPQEGTATSGRTLYEEVETAFGAVLEIERRLAEAQESLARLSPGAAEYREMLEVVGELQHRLEDMDAFRMKSKIERVLMGLGFSLRDFGRRTEEFSGGWQMRIELAKLLLCEPSVLLLDEPTNHLDIESLQWLESHLHGYDGAVVLVSHDRALLDALTTRTIALRSGGAEEFPGNYSTFVTLSAERRELQERTLRNRRKEAERTQEFIDRFRYKATKARQVQSRIKRLEKMEMIEPDEPEEEIHFTFLPSPPAGRIALQLRDVHKRYGSVGVFTGLTCTIEQGDRIAVLGVNGAGKSTFARILAGVEVVTAGERTEGHNVRISYFAQHQAEELDPGRTVLQVVDEAARGDIRRQLRSLLGAFLFHGDDVFKSVAVLSGGEKSRLALARMLLQPANVLIMDEPTNHLDMRSKEVLQAALASYDGTLVIVSHDRAFLDPLVTKVLEFSPGSMRTYLGSVSEYLERKRRERERAPARGETGTRGHAGKPTAKERKRMEAEQRQEKSRRLRPMKERMAVLEREIDAMEARKQELEQLLADPASYKSEARARSGTAEYAEVTAGLERAYRDWEELNRALEDN